MSTGFELGRRFFALTLIGYILAVGSAVVAVQFASQPILKKMQQEALIDHAEANARNVEIRLAEATQTLNYIARNREIVNFVIGDVESPDRMLDFLASVEIEDDVRRVTAFDFSGNALISQDFLPDALEAFFPAEKVVEAKAVLEKQTEDAQYLYRPGDSAGQANFLIAVPIFWRGAPEGALVFEREIDLSEVVDLQTTIGTQRLATRFQAEMAGIWESDPSDTQLTPIPQTSFFLVLEPDQGALRAIGNEIVKTVMVSVGFILTIPFGLMFGAGYRSIVTPHKALAASQDELRRKQGELRELAEIAERSNDAFIITDIEGKVIWGNSAFTETTGYDVDEMIGKRPGDVLQGSDTDPEERARISVALKQQIPIRSEILNYHKDGTPYWISLSISPLLNDDGEVHRFVAVSADITAQKKQTEAVLQAKRDVEYQALHDPLTGMSNRRRLDIELTSICDSSDERTLVRIDLDHFKYVNDTLGHAAGDFVLIEVSRILAELSEDEDLAARVGGDEFVILLGPRKTIEQARTLAEKCLVEIRKDMEFEGRHCRVGASFGIASAASDVVSNPTLLLAADAALYLAKEQGRNTVEVYSQKMHTDVIEKRVLAAEIEEAIADRAFEPYFQPQFDAKTGALAGMEALVRWNHPSRGILTPDIFLPVAYQLSVVDAIDRIVLAKGLQTVQDLNRAGHQVPKISFNVVAKQLEDPEWRRLAKSIEIGSTVISFEVLESVLVEAQSSFFHFEIDRLKEEGFQIEVDDFGSGHASIIGLTQLAPSAMKIDQRLIFPLTEVKSARQMVHAIIEIGKALDIKVTAEGVESAEHAAILAEMGCDTLQGYHFAKPLPASELRQFLDQRASPQKSANAS